MRGAASRFLPKLRMKDNNSRGASLAETFVSSSTHTRSASCASRLPNLRPSSRIKSSHSENSSDAEYGASGFVGSEGAAVEGML